MPIEVRRITRELRFDARGRAADEVTREWVRWLRLPTECCERHEMVGDVMWSFLFDSRGRLTLVEQEHSG